jgi:hypothetical protein
MFPVGQRRPVRCATVLPPSHADNLEIWDPQPSGTSGPVQECTGIAKKIKCYISSPESLEESTSCISTVSVIPKFRAQTSVYKIPNCIELRQIFVRLQKFWTYITNQLHGADPFSRNLIKYYQQPKNLTAFYITGMFIIVFTKDYAF